MWEWEWAFNPKRVGSPRVQAAIQDSHCTVFSISSVQLKFISRLRGLPFAVAVAGLTQVKLVALLVDR